MKKGYSLPLLAALAALAGCTYAGGGSSPSMSNIYLTSSQCYQYDYARTGASWCSPRMR